MSGARFQYALEPILLTRQWDLDALMAELSLQNEVISKRQDDLAVLQSQHVQAHADWKLLTTMNEAVQVQRLMIGMRYLADLARQMQELEDSINQLVTVRDQLIDRVMASRRAVDAVEKHRDDQKAKFVRLRLCGEFKIADDQWNTLQAGTMNNDN